MSRTLDRIDAALVRHLQNDGRISNKELAGKVGLAPSSCLERVRRLRESGVLRGFTVNIDPAAIGVKLQAMVAVRLASHARTSWEELTAALDERPEVVGIFHVSGEDDLLVHVACRDADHLRDLVLDEISSQPGVRGVQTSLVFAHLASDLPVYLD
jgi:DNA-binding Lrp family transcriptional regulator